MTDENEIARSDPNDVMALEGERLNATAETQAAPNLSAADADADADLARPSRVMQFRAQRRTQISTAIPALLLIAVGVLYLSETLTPDIDEYTQPALIGVGAAALGLALVARFLLNGRRERGLFLVGLVILAWTGLAALVVTESLQVAQAWPLGIAAVGLAIMLTFVFERTHERGLLMPALAFIAAALAALPFALGLISPDVVSVVALVWPLLILLAALLLLPRAIRPREQ